MKSWLKLILVSCLSIYELLAQNFVTSPSVWIFPNCNPQSTNYQIIRSKPQNLSNFTIKWRTNSISGNVQPLVGNIINDPHIDSNFSFAPNEIVAVQGGKIILVDSRGITHKTHSTPIPFLKEISFLFDTLSSSFYPLPNSTLLLGLETIEFENQKDSLAYTYIAGYDEKADTIKFIKRIVIDQRQYIPNLYSSLRPFFGKKFGNEYLLFASSNVYNPTSKETDPVTAPFFRGFSIFPSSQIINTFPLPAITDNFPFRVTLGPDVSFAPPSLIDFGSNQLVLLPNYQTLNLNVNIPNSISLTKTNPTKSYLLAYNLVSNQIRQAIPPLELTSIIDPKGKRPQIRPFFVSLDDSSTPDSIYILLAEEYRGIDSSLGISALHLFDGNFSALTFPNDPLSPSFIGSNNVVWSIATGNVDGNSQNQWLPFFPNNPGKEIIATYSSPHHTIAENKIFVLRFRNGNPIPKPSPPATYLFPFDTICTFRTSGWVSAVNDIDGTNDEKDEIVLVDGSKIRILRLRDYNTFEFKSGRPFDTVWSYEFPNEIIHKVIIADLDGDALNDLIVTTNNFTYLIGNPLPKLIEVLTPKFSYNPIDICLADTIILNLRSKSITEEKINIRFVPISNGTHQTSNSKIIISNIAINKPNVIFNILVDTSFLNKSGFFYIESSLDTTKVFDSTAVFNFIAPFILYNDSILNEFYYDNISLTYSVSCVDSVIFEYSFDGSNWSYIITEQIDMSTQTTLVSLPCLNVFDCLSTHPTTDALIRARLYKGKNEIISLPVILKIKPKPFQITFPDSSFFCSLKNFSWNPLLLQCDSVEIFISIDGGKNLSFVDKVLNLTGEYKWQTRTNLPDSILFRFCCAKSCQIVDTLVYIPKSSNIQTIAPNPFKPNLQITEINYLVERETNATIRVLDQNNRLVRELVKDSPRLPNTIYCEQWDGKTDNGDVVAPGLYYILLELSSGNKEIFPIFVK